MLLETEVGSFDLEIYYDAPYIKNRATEVRLTHHANRPEDIFVLRGVAECNENDLFTKSFGRKLAFGRAIAFLDRKSRTILWRAFFEKVRI